MEARNRDRYFIRSVDNALHLLEALSESGQDVQITELSQRIGLSKSTVFRLLVTFQRRGYVEQENGSHSYRLGLSAFEVGQKCITRMALLNKARPIMEKLARQSRESIYLTVRRGEEILLVDLADTPQPVKVVSLTGRRIPLAGTAVGKVFAAFDRRKTSCELSPAETETIRNRGYALIENDISPGVVSLAAPLLDYQGRMPGALLLIAPDFRLQTERQRALMAEHLLAASASISLRLGHQKRLPIALGA